VHLCLRLVARLIRQSADGDGSGESLPADHALVQASIVAVVVSLVGRQIPVDQPLMTAGIDSRRAMELTDALEKKLGVELPALLVFNYPNIDAVVNSFAASLKQRLFTTVPRSKVIYSHLFTSPLCRRATFVD
jgi:acyl carrier protein